MKQIRRMCFETNSSSTHSICVTKSNILDQKRNEIIFGLQYQFGWENDETATVQKKAGYLYLGIILNDKTELIEDIKKILDHNNINYLFEEPEYDEYGKLALMGYIDHVGDLIDSGFLEICKDENQLMRYLFSSESFIITGNDNDDQDSGIYVDYECDQYYK